MKLLNQQKFSDRQKNNKSFLWFAGFLLLSIGIFFQNSNTCQAAEASSSTSTDAIAIRVLPNLEHYGIQRWYKEKNFAGAPQFLIVDGYEAIRDGRTVYVNATNIVDNVIYTNIYLISYNQEIKMGTTDALGQIIANWKFNNNVSSFGVCKTGAISTSTCLIDGDCLGKGFCSSNKAKITRDVKRLAVIAELRDALENYKNTNKRYPDLPSGSYVPHLTISTWPSWQNTFGVQLGIDKSLTDPVNKLGACGNPRFEETTCWDKDAGEFATSTDPLRFPNESQVIAYQSRNNGNEYNLCASMESGNIYDTSDQMLSQEACAVAFASTATAEIKFKEINLQGELNQPFIGYVEVSNPNGNPLTWDLSFSGGSVGAALIEAKKQEIITKKAQKVALESEIVLLDKSILAINNAKAPLEVAKNKYVSALDDYSLFQSKVSQLRSLMIQAEAAHNEPAAIANSDLLDTAEKQKNVVGLIVAGYYENYAPNIKALETKIDDLEQLKSDYRQLRNDIAIHVANGDTSFATINLPVLSKLRTKKEAQSVVIDDQIQLYVDDLTTTKNDLVDQINEKNLAIGNFEGIKAAKSAFIYSLVMEVDQLSAFISNAYNVIAISNNAFDGAPVFQETNNPNLRRIYSKKAKEIGVLPVTIEVSDNHGASVATSTYIIISKSKPKIEVENAEHLLNQNPLEYVFYLTDDLITSATATPNYTLKLSGGPSFANPALSSSASSFHNVINNNLLQKIERVARGRYKVTIHQGPGIISGTNGTDKVLNYEVNLKNSSGISTTKKFSISLKQDKPIFDYKCEENVRKYAVFSCVVKLSNSADHTISYTVSGLKSASTSLLTGAAYKLNELKISGRALWPVGDLWPTDMSGLYPDPVTDLGDISEAICSSTDLKNKVFNEKTNNLTFQGKLRGLYQNVLATRGVSFRSFSNGVETITHLLNGRETTTQILNGREVPVSSRPIDDNLPDVGLPDTTLPDPPADSSHAADIISSIIGNISPLKEIFKISKALADEVDWSNPNLKTDPICWKGDFKPKDYSSEFDATLTGSLASVAAALPNSYNIVVTASNEYGATSSSSFDLNINSYCGDGVKQAPNQEGRGGFYNDGMEECDGVGGTTNVVASSSASKQYSCTTKDTVQAVQTISTPNPITSNNYCRATGGYCGDGICGKYDSTFTTDDMEVYDPGANNAQYCHADCPYCGDGVVESKFNEECDPGDPFSVNSELGEYCSSDCRISRQLKILQVFPTDTSASTTLSVKAMLDSLGNSYESFRDAVNINDTNPAADEVNYSVAATKMSSFNSTTLSFLPATGDILQKYNLIIFGMGVATSSDLSTSSAATLKSFIKAGGMVIFGDKTINSQTSRKFNSFNSYAGVVNINNFNDSSLTSLIVDNFSAPFINTAALAMPTSSFGVAQYKAYYQMGASGVTGCDSQCGEGVCTATSSKLMNLFHYSGMVGVNVWGSICNRVALSHLTYSSAGSKPNELESFGNIINYLSRLVSGDNF
ncbi:MAG: hypothetical protein ACOYMB_03075 [Patescibacteria group bacterium]